MWRLVTIFFALALEAVAADPIRCAILDPERVVELPVSREVTAVVFPGPIDGVAGADMIIDSAKGAVDVEEGSPERFQVSHALGSNFLLIRSLQPGAGARLTALFEGAAYVMQLHAVENDSVASLIFKRAESGLAVKVEAPPAPVAFTPRIGLSLLDRARAYPVLVRALPKAVEGVTVRTPNQKIVLPNLEITVKEVYRFPREDALVFLLRLHNPTARVVDIDPSSFAVRIAQERFEQAIADGPRSLDPGETAEAEFAIVGMVDGTRNDLSADNAFTILVNCAGRETKPGQPSQETKP